MSRSIRWMGIIIVLLLGCREEPTHWQPKWASFDRWIDSLSTADKFSGVIFLADSGMVIYCAAHGLRLRGNEPIPLDTNSVFELASVSKQFTAMAVLLLALEGKLRLDDPLEKYFPELPYRGIKVSHLLNHTSGLPDYVEYLSARDTTYIFRNSDVIRYLASSKPAPLFEAGTKWEYCNTGYVLLASLVERVSGESFGKVVNHKIFAPLGMQSSQVYHRRLDSVKIENYALGYIQDSTRAWRLPDEDPRFSFVRQLDGIEGDGIINSTASDLWRWSQALFNHRLVTNSTWDSLLVRGIIVPESNSKELYAQGLFVEKLDSTTYRWTHGGGWPGYSTLIEMYPHRNAALIVLTNSLPLFDSTVKVPSITLVVDSARSLAGLRPR